MFGTTTWTISVNDDDRITVEEIVGGKDNPHCPQCFTSAGDAIAGIAAALTWELDTRRIIRDADIESSVLLQSHDGPAL